MVDDWQKNGASALALKRMLGLGSYRTAWTWLHKLHRAMVRPGRENLSGIVEMDETFIGGIKPGKRGRGAEGIRRIRLGTLKDTSGESLTSFVKDRIIRGSIIRTDDWVGYPSLESNGYHHVRSKKRYVIRI